KGLVMIQTSIPNHPLLQHVARHDYVGMYQEEIDKRKQFFYPPFSRIIHISFKHKSREVVADAAKKFALALEAPYGKYVVGPAEPVISRVRNLFLMEMLLKLPRDAQTITRCKEDILKHIAILHSEKTFASVIILPDVDAL
ncbi:MAG: primosomal protein N', partial [Chitinophagaceae bacterium]